MLANNVREYCIIILAVLYLQHILRCDTSHLTCSTKNVTNQFMFSFNS